MALAARSRLDPDALAVDRRRRDPAVDAPPVVADLEPPSPDRLDQVEVLRAADLAEHDVAEGEVRRVHRRDGTELPGLDPPGHGIATGVELDDLARLQPRYVRGSSSPCPLAGHPLHVPRAPTRETSRVVSLGEPHPP